MRETGKSRSRHPSDVYPPMLAGMADFECMLRRLVPKGRTGEGQEGRKRRGGKGRMCVSLPGNDALTKIKKWLMVSFFLLIPANQTAVSSWPELFPLGHLSSSASRQVLCRRRLPWHYRAPRFHFLCRSLLATHAPARN